MSGISWNRERIRARITELHRLWQTGAFPGYRWNNKFLLHHDRPVLRAMERHGLRSFQIVHEVGGEVARDWMPARRERTIESAAEELKAAHERWLRDEERGKPAGKPLSPTYLERGGFGPLHEWMYDHKCIQKLLEILGPPISDAWTTRKHRAYTRKGKRSSPAATPKPASHKPPKLDSAAIKLCLLRAHLAWERDPEGKAAGARFGRDYLVGRGFGRIVAAGLRFKGDLEGLVLGIAGGLVEDWTPPEGVLWPPKTDVPETTVEPAGPSPLKRHRRERDEDDVVAEGADDPGVGAELDERAVARLRSRGFL